MATIIDVAKAAGVSKSLVSRYLNGGGGVGKQSALRIEKAIKQLNYRPNGIARSLVLQKTHSIGIVLDSVHASFVAPFIEGIEQGLTDSDAEKEYSVLYCASGGDLQRKQRNVKYLTEGRVDALLIYGSLVTDSDIIKSLAKSNFPFLLVENKAEGIKTNKVLIDNFSGAVKATEYLIQLGHTDIAFMAGDERILITKDREDGFKKAMTDSGLIVPDKFIIRPDFTLKYKKQNPRHAVRGDYTYYVQGYICMKKFIEENAENLPTAMFFASDIMAFGAIQALCEAGLNVPEDMSIIGFDNENPQDFDCDCPRVTTLRQPLFSAGYNAIRMLLEELKCPSLEKRTLTLCTDLIDNKTCRNLLL